MAISGIIMKALEQFKFYRLKETTRFKNTLTTTLKGTRFFWLRTGTLLFYVEKTVTDKVYYYKDIGNVAFLSPKGICYAQLPYSVLDHFLEEV